MPFFVNKSGKTVEPKKRKAQKPVAEQQEKKKKDKRSHDDEIESDFEEGNEEEIQYESEGEEQDEESATQKRFRLAKEYLTELEKKATDAAAEREGAVDVDVESVDRDAIAETLQKESLDKLGRLYRKIADSISVTKSGIMDNKLAAPEVEIVKRRRLVGHGTSPVCLYVDRETKTCYSGSKDGRLIKHDLETGRHLRSLKWTNRGGSSQIHSVVGCFGKILCVGCADGMIRIYDSNSLTPIKDLSGHKEAVSGLSVRRNQPHLYSCSFDKTIKIWNLEQMGYVDTLFGHKEAILSIDSLTRERCLTAGGGDRTLRLWKIADDSQLLFNGPVGCGSVECASLINDEHFLSGHLNGSLAVWSMFKKRPLYVTNVVHGRVKNEPRWIVSLAACPYTDLVASGSHDGAVRLWKVGDGYKRLEAIGSVPLPGFVNALSFVPESEGNGPLLVCAVGREHKSGRWWKQKNCSNAVVVLNFSSNL